MSEGRKRSFEDAFRIFRRRLAYRLFRPRPPRHPRPFTGPVLVVGSAPVSNLPKDFDSRFSVITVNGSQAVTACWGLGPPDVTFMQVNQVEGITDNARAVRQNLKGKHTRLLYVVRWKNGRKRLKRGLAAFDFSYDRLRILSRYRRMALYEAVLGRLNLETDNDTKFSNGVTAVLYAAVNGAPAIVITGIDPSSKGHVYNRLDLPRLHANTDRELLQEIRARGFPLYTADPDVATSLGLPLWGGTIQE